MKRLLMILAILAVGVVGAQTQVRRIPNLDVDNLTVHDRLSATINGEIDIAGQATGGDGTEADPWTGWETPLNAITASGGTFVFAPGHYQQNTAIVLPVNTDDWINIYGYGATIHSTASAPRVFDMGRTADYQTFNKLRIFGLSVDNEQTLGKHHVLMGCLINNVNVCQRLNLADIEIKDVRVFNVYWNVSTATDARYPIWFASINGAASLGAPNIGGSGPLGAVTVERIHFDNVRTEGGLQGITVAANKPGGQSEIPANVYFDDILVQNCNITGGGWSTTFSGESRIHVGNRGFGKRVRILNNNILYSLDVGIEINAMEDVLVEGNTVAEVHNSAYYFTHYNDSLDKDKQMIVYRNNRAIRTNYTTGSQNYAKSFAFRTDGGGFDIGHIVLEGNSVYVNTPDFELRGYGLEVDASSTHSVKSVTVRGFTFVHEGIAETDNPCGAGTFPCNPEPIRIATGTTAFTPVSISDLYVKLNGTVAGSLVDSVVAVELSGNPMKFDIDRATFDMTVNGLGATGLRGIMIGQAAGSWNMTGTMRHLSFPVFSSDTDLTGQAVKIRNSTLLTIPSPITIVDSDFSGLTLSGQSSVTIDDSTNANKVRVTQSHTGAGFSGTTANERSATFAATGGDGSSSSPYTGWLAALPSSSTTPIVLKFDPNTYYALSAAKALPAGATLRCADRSSVISFTAIGAVFTNQTNAGDITIENCTIDGNDDALGASTVGLIEITPGTGTNYRIINNALLDSSKDAVRFAGGTSGTPTKVWVQNNRVLTADRHGIEMSTDISDFHITGNTLSGTNETTVGASIFASDSTTTLGEVSGNYVKGSGDNSIRMKGSYHKVDGNTTETGKTDAIRIESDYTTVTGNVIKTPDEWGVKVDQGHDNIVIDGNYCVGAGTDNDGNGVDSGHCFGTYTATGTGRIEFVMISNNQAVNGVQDGIHLESFDATNNSQNISVIANTVTGATVNGIRATSNSTYTIAGNMVSGSGSANYSLAGTDVAFKVPNGSNCSAGNAPLGLDGDLNAEGCYDVYTETEGAAHAALTTAHGSTDAATASAIMQRDASGRAKVVAPAAADSSTLIPTSAWTGTEIASGTYTLTNKTYDAAGTGNTLTSTFKIRSPIELCGGAARADWQLSGAAGSCVAGTNVTFGGAAFDGAADECAHRELMVLPSDWSSSAGITAKVEWTVNSTTAGNVVWYMNTFCLADGEAEAAASWGTNAAFSADGYPGGTVYLWQMSGPTALDLTGCAANEALFVRLCRDGDGAGDTLDAIDAFAMAVEFTLTRAQ